MRAYDFHMILTCIFKMYIRMTNSIRFIMFNIKIEISLNPFKIEISLNLFFFVLFMSVCIYIPPLFYCVYVTIHISPCLLDSLMLKINKKSRASRHCHVNPVN